MTATSHKQAQASPNLYEQLRKPDLTTQRADDKNSPYAKDDIDHFERAVKEAKESKKKSSEAETEDENENDPKTIMTSMTHINFASMAHINFAKLTDDQSSIKIEAHRLSDGNQKLIEEINRVVELISIRSSEVGPDVKISVKQDILRDTEILLSQLQNGKIQVHFEANDVRALQTIAFYKDMLAERLGDSYQISVRDATSLDLGQNSDHESSTKQEAFAQNESDQKTAQKTA